MKPAINKRVLLLTFLFVGVVFLVVPKAVLGYAASAPATGPGSPPVCTAQVPDKPWLYRAEAAGAGKVDLFWDRTERATSWTVAYGVAPGTYIYGVHNFGDGSSRGLTISALPAGKYYFVVRANNDCMPGPFSNEWPVSVGRGAAVTVPVAKVTPAPGAPTAPKITPTPGVRYVPPPTREEPKVTVSPLQPPAAAPAPQPGIFQRIVNFFLGLFGVR